MKESEPGGGEQLPQAELQRDDQDDQSKTRARGLDITSRDISLQGECEIPVQSFTSNSYEPESIPGEPDLAQKSFHFQNQLIINPDTK